MRRGRYQNSIYADTLLCIYAGMVASGRSKLCNYEIIKLRNLIMGYRRSHTPSGEPSDSEGYLRVKTIQKIGLINSSRTR
jgi:hypothetical protein